MNTPTMAQTTNGLGLFIYNTRRAKGLSRGDLAERLTQNGYECTESAINHWEKGRADAPIEDARFARALSAALDVPPSQIARAAGVFNLPPETMGEVLSRLSPATLALLKEAGPDEIKKIEALIRAFLTES